VSGSPATLTPANNERFYIRRARLKLTYDSSPLSQAVVYFDGGQDRTIRLLEAYVTLLDPWTAHHTHALTVGQMNVPFGYEIERSSSVRELPERSRAENVLFSGERDRGMKLVNQWTLRFETVLAILNGGGINQPDFPNADPTRGKDFLARARYSQGTIDGAVSYYTGRNTTPLTGPDVQTDKTRFGFDAQAYYELPRLGGGSLKGEYFAGKNANADSLKALVVEPTTANPVRLLRAGADPAHLATDFVGGYVMWVQNLGERFQAAARYDVYDPNSDLDHDQFARVSLGANWFYDGFTRVTVAYDIPKTDALIGGVYDDPHDNLWTVQVQHKF
jgi:phosphate-selective porin O/P